MTSQRNSQPKAHEIRLRGPWQAQPLARTTRLPDGSVQPLPGPLPAATQVSVPDDWGRWMDQDFGGQVRYQRNFGCPSGLGPGDRVELVLDDVNAWADVSLNGQPLGRILRGHVARFEIRRLLRPRNALVVLVEKPADNAAAEELQPPAATSTATGTAATLQPARPGGITGEVRLVIVPQSE
jgi:hypothetical protein